MGDGHHSLKLNASGSVNRRDIAIPCSNESDPRESCDREHDGESERGLGDHCRGLWFTYDRSSPDVADGGLHSPF